MVVKKKNRGCCHGNPAGNFSHVTSFQRGYEVEITLRRRLTSIQRRIDVVFPTRKNDIITTSYRRHA